MNDFQIWLNEKALEVIVWAWSLIAPTAFWVCCCGAAVCYIAYICTQNKASATNGFKFVFAYLIFKMFEMAVAK